MGITHAGFGAASNVAFGKFMGTGRADYSRIATGDGTVYGLVYIDRYQNQDVGGTMVKADGSRYCDMRGIGSDDYIWISSTGDMTIYGNEHVWGSWIQYGEVFNINRARREIAFADFDGDGKCDISKYIQSLAEFAFKIISEEQWFSGTNKSLTLSNTSAD